MLKRPQSTLHTYKKKVLITLVILSQDLQLHRKCCSDLGHLVHVSLIRSRMTFYRLWPILLSVHWPLIGWRTSLPALVYGATCTHRRVHHHHLLKTWTQLPHHIKSSHQWAAWTVCEGNPKHYRPFLDLSMAQLSIHAKIHSPICPNWFFDPMGGIKLCDLNRSHHFIKKTCWYGICLAQAQRHLNITLSPDHSGIKRNIQSMTFMLMKPNIH